MHDFPSRYQRFLRRLAARRLDGFITRHPPHLFYLFAFSGSSGLAFCLEGETRLFVDSRYLEQVQAESVNCTPVLTPDSQEQTLRRILRRCRNQRIGFESAHTSHRLLSHLSPLAGRTPGPELVPTVQLIEELRVVKEDTEIETIEQAFRIAHLAYSRFLEKISAGLTELEMAALLEFEIRRAGGEGTSFETMVASGNRSSLPHGRASTRKWQPNELLLIDFGVRYQGYTSDMTRLHLAEGTRKTALYRIVREAQQSALECIRPGQASTEVDAAARNFIRRAGYGDCFGHSTGHGLGLEVHELPLISSRRPTRLREGMVFTVEPGIYLPGRYGVRIEDAVVVTQTGYRLLSQKN